MNGSPNGYLNTIPYNTILHLARAFGTASREYHFSFHFRLVQRLLDTQFNRCQNKLHSETAVADNKIISSNEKCKQAQM